MSIPIEDLRERFIAEVGAEPGAEFLTLLDVLGDVAAHVTVEAALATTKWPPFNSAHEGYAVLLEEVHELQTHVFTNQKRRDLAEMRQEAIQVAAMAMRFVHDVCDGERGRK